jgi:hypothetical protein
MNETGAPRLDAPAAVLQLAADVERDLAGTPAAAAAAKIRERLDGPLRVAIAGRVKAGKSTLLNALVGERLAPTDAGECTKLVSWYERGDRYEVIARRKDGKEQPLTFDRDDGALDVHLGGLAEHEVDRLEVRWPTQSLARITLIDTPGLASINDENSRRTRDFLEADGDSPTDADAVIYLMRHLHRSDVDFLDAFMDRTVSAASPVNAVAVLSRADEIGGGRLDAMDSAARIAARYCGDDQVRSLCADVVPIAGLLAETGLTLREEEVGSLRTLAAEPPEQLERMLLGAEQFCDLHGGVLPVEVRRELLGRLGLYGVRASLQLLAGGATTAASLGPALVERSGLEQLRRVMNEHFMPRARVLKARSALLSLRRLARELATVEPAVADKVARTAEQIEASAIEFARMRAAHLVTTGAARFPDADRGELQRLLLAATPAAALGLEFDPAPDAVRSAAQQAVQRWRTKATNPLADRTVVEVCETAARSAEALYIGV